MSTTGLSLTSPAVSTQNLSQARSTQALHNLQTQSKDGNSAKIEKAARDFESVLLGEWLQQAEKSFASVPGGDPNQDADAGHDQFQSIGCQFLGAALSKAGGIGIGAMISKRLKAMQATRAATDGNPAEGDQSNQVRPRGEALHGSQAK